MTDSRASRGAIFTLAGILLILMFTLAAALSHTTAGPEMLGASIFMVALTGVFAGWAMLRRVRIDLVSNVRRVHWLQACVHASIFLAIATYFPPMRLYIPLLLFQLVFANLVQILLTSVLRRRFELSFGVFPIVLSVNLFLWFQPFQTYCQLAMIALAVASKLLLVRADGRHIFNPSAFAAAIAVYGVTFTQPAHVADLVSPYLLLGFYAQPTYIYIHIFLVSLLSLALADRFLVAASGVAVMVAAYWVPKLAFGVPLTPYVMDPNLFVGFALLVTDPATSPKSKRGQALFGATYAVSVIAAFALLEGVFGFGQFFAKIFFVPFLNAAVPLFEKAGTRLGPPTILSVFSRKTAQAALYAAVFFFVVTYTGPTPRCTVCFKRNAAMEKQAQEEKLWNKAPVINDSLKNTP